MLAPSSISLARVASRVSVVGRGSPEIPVPYETPTESLSYYTPRTSNSVIPSQHRVPPFGTPPATGSLAQRADTNHREVVARARNRKAEGGGYG